MRLRGGGLSVVLFVCTTLISRRPQAICEISQLTKHLYPSRQCWVLSLDVRLWATGVAV